MKTIINEPISGTLLAYLLANNQFVVAEVYTITLANGTTLYYTSSDSDVSWGGHSFSSRGLLLNRSKINQMCGVEVDEMDIEIYPTTATIGGLGFITAVRNGALDGASILLQRAFYPGWGQPTLGGYNLFGGYVSDIDFSRTKVNVKVQSLFELLSSQWPAMIYQPGCGWQLYGSGCGLVKASWTVTGLVGATSLSVNGFSTNLTQADDYFDKGVVTFTSGLNSGTVRTIKNHLHAAGLINLIMPLNNIPVAGDAFTIYPGCDHTLGTCGAKFSNTANFKGFPFIPVPETVF